MPVELHVIRASEFVCLDVRSRLDFEASKNALQALVFACHKRGLQSALLDLRSLPVLSKPHFTPNELAGLVATFREAGFSRQQRLALLYSSDIYGGIRTFAFVNRLRGLQVRPFTEFEAALQWLSEGQGGADESEQAETPVPIIRPARKIKKISAGSTTGGPLDNTSGRVRKAV
jgi:hypothetical protein